MDAPFIDTGFLTSDGVRLRVLEAGGAAAGGPAIAFIPGWSMPAAIWKKPLALLAAHHHVLALDPRGQGASEVPAGGYEIGRRAEDIAEFVACHPGAVLVAWSLGALESLEYLRVHGTAGVSALVIVDSSVGEGRAGPAPDEAGAGFRAALRRDRDRALGEFVRAIFRTPQPEAQLEALRAAASRMPLEASLSLFPGGRFPGEHWRDIVRGFDKPLLYMVTPQFSAQAASLKTSRPHTEVEVYPDAGHALFVDEPERFAARIAAFVASLPAR